MVSSKLIKRDKYFLSLFSFGSEPKKLNKIFLQIASLLIPLLIWTIVCQLKLVSEMFLPSPLAVFYSLLDMAEVEYYLKIFLQVLVGYLLVL